MTEPYHPFIKRTPEGDDRDNLCATCDRGPGDPVHNPTPENYPTVTCEACGRQLLASWAITLSLVNGKTYCVGCTPKEKPPTEAEG